jgi:hypothetical protein
MDEPFLPLDFLLLALPFCEFGWWPYGNREHESSHTTATTPASHNFQNAVPFLNKNMVMQQP